MQFILNLCLREIRSSWRRLLFFFVCIAIGVASIVALRSLIQNLNRSLASEARFFMTADLEISSTSPFSLAETEVIERITGNSNIVEARDETIQTNSMSRPTDLANQTAQILELKGVSANFPLVGEFLLTDNKPFSFNLLENNGAIVQELLFDRLNVKIGDKIRIGLKDFEIRGTFLKEPGDVGGFRLGPRVFIEKKAFDEAGLTAFGARNRRKILLRTSENPESLVRELRTELKQINSVVQARTYRESQADISESFDRAENFLSLAGLVILVLGGIGVWNVTRVFVEQKKKTIAILKCVGASGSRVILAYLLQVLTLGFFGSLLGIVLAQLALWFVEFRFAESLPSQMSYGLQSSAILQGILLGIGVSILFSALPLLQIRGIKPNLLLRDQDNEQTRRFDFLSIFTGVLSSFGLLILAVWQADSWKIGAYFLGGLALTAGILYFLAFALTNILRSLRVVPNFAFRQSLTSLYRPGNQTRVILLAVGLGVFVILAVQSLQTNLLREFDLTRGQSLPKMLLIDIQKRQTEAVRQLIKEEIGENVNVIPTVRGKISAINGQIPDFAKLPTRQNQGQLGREYVLSYRGELVGDEKIVAGKFWENSPASEAEISVDESLRGLQGLDVGSTVTFDILGQKINAKVTSIRNVDVRDTRATFLILFRPGVLEDAPTSFLAPILTDADAATRSRLQRKLFDSFPNISAIDTTDAISTVKKLVDNIVLAVSFVGFFVILSGILILIGSIALTKFQRIYENAILKTLGAKRRLLTIILIGEYGILGLTAGIIGAISSVILSYTVSRFVLKINWQFDVSQLFIGLAATVLLVVMVGVISSFDVLFRKPLATLRSQ